MSELIQIHDNRATIRWKLLTGASALALSAYVSSTALAKADDADRPTLWIELGGQMEQTQGMSAPVVAPFMTLTPVPDVYKGISFLGSQNQARFAFGAEGKITFQPEGSDWNFSAGVRYGRSHANRHKHNQLDKVGNVPWSFTFYGYPYQYNKYISSAPIADTQTQTSERHLVLDFTAGKDVGLGLFGRDSSSTINAGVRFASFAANSTAYITARPEVNTPPVTEYLLYGLIEAQIPFPTFHQYAMHAHATRSFKGVGPSLSWNASTAIAGSPQDGELTLDWGINAALLFGKQKAKVSHTTQAYHYVGVKYDTSYSLTYRSPHHSTRSRSVTVANIGGFAGLSLKWTNAKISIGYRYDTFLNAMDTGIDTANKSNVTFNGPYASISIGIGD